MKRRPVLLSRCASFALGGLLLPALVAPAFSQRSVIIPAQSSSTIEESAGADPVPPPAAPVVPLGSSLTTKSQFSQIPVPTSIPGKGSVEVQTTPLADPAPDTDVVAVQRVEPTKPPLDVATAKRLAELRRELRIAESAAQARISLPADDLFVATEEEVIDPLAVPALKELVEYLERTLKKDVTIKSLHVPGEEGAKEKAWRRVLVLMDWLRENSSLDPDRFRAAAPRPLDKPAPKANATSIGETEFVARIELHLQ